MADIRLVRADDPRVAPVVEAHVARMDDDEGTPPEARFRVGVDALVDESVTFFAAFDVPDDPHAPAIAIGAYAAKDDGWGEVKSMHVVADRRGEGLSRLILDAIEAEARRQGAAALRLETARHFAAAQTLYRSAGFRERGPFGDYPDHPVSRFYEKRLA